MTKRVKLNDYIQKKIAEDSLEVELPDGTVCSIPPAVCWPDISDMKNDEAAVAIMGEEGWAAWVAAGGTLAQFNFLAAERDELDSLGE